MPVPYVKKEGRLGLSEVKFGSAFNPAPPPNPSGAWGYFFYKNGDETRHFYKV
jgi:hypothetical protein